MRFRGHPGAHGTNPASRGRQMRNQVVRLLHDAGLPAGALARLEWCTARDPERLRRFAAESGVVVGRARWRTLVRALDELWLADAALGHGALDSYVVRFYGGSDLATRAIAIRRIVGSQPYRPISSDLPAAAAGATR